MINVLILEDDAVFGEVLKAELESHGAYVNWCPSYLGALESLRSLVPDFAIVDYRVGRMFLGTDLCKYLRKNGVPYCICTSEYEDKITNGTAKDNAEFIVQKPVDLNELSEKIISQYSIEEKSRL